MPNLLRVSVSTLGAVIVAIAVYGQAAGQQLPARPGQQAGSVFAHADIDRAWNEVKATNRPLLLFVSMDDCRFCDKMEQETFSHPALARNIRKLFVTAKAKKESDPQLVEQLGVRAYPTTLLISPEGELIARIEGFLDPKKFATTVRPVLAKQAQSQGRTAARPPAPQRPAPARQ